MSSRFARRRFLALAASSSALFACKREDEHAKTPSHASTPNDAEANAPLVNAASRARASGRPLLVMLEQVSRLPRDHAWVWTKYLELADSRALADLALCELAFTSCARAIALWPGAELNRSDVPLAIVVMPDDEKIARVRLDQVGLESLRALQSEDHVHAEAEQKRVWVRSLAAELRRVIAPDEATFELRARRVLGETTLAREEWPNELARRMREFLATSAPAGARWAHDNGCGAIDIDGELVGEAQLCGIGYVDETSRRFLHLYPAR